MLTKQFYENMEIDVAVEISDALNSGNSSPGTKLAVALQGVHFNETEFDQIQSFELPVCDVGTDSPSDID